MAPWIKHGEGFTGKFSGSKQSVGALDSRGKRYKYSASPSLRMVDRRNDVALWKIPNTGHSTAIDTAPQELQIRLISWFEQHGNSQLH